MRFSVYRCFNADGVLLYVGSTRDVDRRMVQHKSNSHWFDCVASTNHEHHKSQDEMLRAERAAIKAERPLYNIKGLIAPDHQAISESKQKFAEVAIKTAEGAVDAGNKMGGEMLSFVRQLQSLKSKRAALLVCEKILLDALKARGHTLESARASL